MEKEKSGKDSYYCYCWNGRRDHVTMCVINVTVLFSSGMRFMNMSSIEKVVGLFFECPLERRGFWKSRTPPFFAEETKTLSFIA